MVEPKVLRSATRMRNFGLMGVRAKGDDGGGCIKKAKLTGETGGSTTSAYTRTVLILLW